MKINTAFNRWLFCCLFFIGIMIAVRSKFAGNYDYLFLVWNLFLAWIPYVFSEFFKGVTQKAKWKQAVLFASWLVFFPNALYIVTDIIHLEETPGVPLWYDAALLFTSSFAGLALAFASLMNAEIFLGTYFTKRQVAVSAAFLLFLGSFGVYLGRFKRWNSWNVVNDPLALVKDIAGNFTSPADNYKTWGIVFFLTILYSICWYALKLLPKHFTKRETTL